MAKKQKIKYMNDYEKIRNNIVSDYLRKKIKMMDVNDALKLYFDKCELHK